MASLIGPRVRKDEADKAGRQSPPREPVLEEAVHFKEYNETLILEPEDKRVELDSAMASLERESAGRNQDEGYVTIGQGDRP